MKEKEGGKGGLCVMKEKGGLCVMKEKEGRKGGLCGMKEKEGRKKIFLFFYLFSLIYLYNVRVMPEKKTRDTINEMQ